MNFSTPLNNDGDVYVSEALYGAYNAAHACDLTTISPLLARLSIRCKIHRK